MKFKQLMKYKWSILFMIVAVFVLCNSIREGFTSDTIGEYEYLKPLSGSTTLDETTESKFITAFNNVNTSYKGLTSEISSSKNFNATIEEFNYYIINNKWPYGSYISTYVTNNLKTISSTMGREFDYTTPTPSNIQGALPTRMVYSLFAKDEDSKKTPTPMAYDIFMGTKPPPVSDKPSLSPDKPDSLSPDNYQKLQSICSSLAK